MLFSSACKPAVSYKLWEAAVEWHHVGIGRGIGWRIRSSGVFILGWAINLLYDLEQIRLTWLSKAFALLNWIYTFVSSSFL